MHYYAEHKPFGREISLVLNNRDEVEAAVSGADHAEQAEATADEWNNVEQIWRDLGGEGG